MIILILQLDAAAIGLTRLDD